MIRSFRCSETEKLHQGLRSRKFVAIGFSARTRLERLDAATSLLDLSRLPGNRLEALSRDRKGQHSIRINDQYRICFVGKDAGAEDVEIVDYHGGEGYAAVRS